MRLVVDANILVAELMGERGRKLIIRPELELYMAEKAWDEAIYELNKRIVKMVKRKVFAQPVGQNLLANAITLAEAKVSIVVTGTPPLNGGACCHRLPRLIFAYPTASQR